MPCTAAMQKCKGRHSSEFVKRACSALKPLATLTVGKWKVVFSKCAHHIKSFHLIGDK